MQCCGSSDQQSPTPEQVCHVRIEIEMVLERPQTWLQILVPYETKACSEEHCHHDRAVFHCGNYHIRYGSLI